jgi:hypothetical protein
MPTGVPVGAAPAEVPAAAGADVVLPADVELLLLLLQAASRTAPAPATRTVFFQVVFIVPPLLSNRLATITAAKAAVNCCVDFRNTRVDDGYDRM